MAQDQNVTLSPERQALRARAQVRLIQAEEEGLGIRRLPEGVYGFSSAASSDEIPLFSKPIYGAFEVHKLAGGEVAWIGYVRESDYERFEKGGEPFDMELYPEPYGDATRLVSVPAARVDRRRPQARENGMPMRVEVAPRIEMMDLAAQA
ncbi:MAG: hypothetical protein KatS3mg005_0197 [Bryobacteraceae bacterium]|jgi:hypothetical protein|nr:MAG: hypothetical protein KatS3mg005_0197 [Bryobacteraceae bacterium]